MKKNFSVVHFIILALLTLACLGMAILASNKVSKSNNELTEERYLRMVAEEKFEKAKAKISLSENQLDKAQKEIASLSALLDQEKVATQSLRLDIEKARRLNDVLQRELQNALVTQPEPIQSE